jgi:hypothetical protein
MICLYDDSIIFYLTEKRYIYEWLISKNRDVPKKIIEDIMSNDPESWGITSRAELKKAEKNIKDSDSYVQKALLVFKACQDFYSMKDLHDYLNQNNLSIGIEVVIEL